MTCKKILSKRRYKAGYEVREELCDGSEYNGSDFIMKTAYTHSGDYIGDPKIAHFLCKKKGLKLEKISPDYNVCSIGFSEEEQKWWGFSHRAMYGFGIGSKVRKGDCAYTPRNILELYAGLTDSERKRIIGADINGLTIEHYSYKAVPIDPNNPDSDLKCSDPIINSYIINTGRGEWEAKTLEDCRQMAVDFARSVA
jgi:hypothetical protein